MKTRLDETNKMRKLMGLSLIVEGNTDPTQWHRYDDMSDSGIESLFADPLNTDIIANLTDRLKNDRYSNPKNPTNIGKGTRKLRIYLNNTEYTVDQFISKIQQDHNKGFCHSIDEYDYNNRFLGATQITIKTEECDEEKGSVGAKTIKKKPCEVDIMSPPPIPKNQIPQMQEWCKKNKKSNGQPCYPIKRKIDQIWGCESQKCWNQCDPPPIFLFFPPNGNM